jgi:hypothetical protein
MGKTDKIVWGNKENTSFRSWMHPKFWQVVFICVAQWQELVKVG